MHVQTKRDFGVLQSLDPFGVCLVQNSLQAEQEMCKHIRKAIARDDFTTNTSHPGTFFTRLFSTFLSIRRRAFKIYVYILKTRTKEPHTSCLEMLTEMALFGPSTVAIVSTSQVHRFGTLAALLTKVPTMFKCL